MNYNPNWKDPRVQARVNKVLDWAAPYVIGKHGSVVPLHLSAKGFTDKNGVHVPGLNDIFGPKGNALGDYLRSAILIPESKSYIPGEKSMTYRMSRDGYEGVRAASTAYGDTSFDDEAHDTSALSLLITKHAEELQTKNFKYKDQSDRLWHPLQNLPRATKHQFWQDFGLPFDYDIVACAPSILFSLARKNGAPPILLETLQAYLDNRQGFRQHIAALTGLTHEDAKRLVNSLFNGAKLGANPYWSSFKMLGFDTEAMDRLKADQQVRNLRRNIATVWRHIELDRRMDTRLSLDEAFAGKKQADWKLTKARAKWGVYFQFERRVLNAVTEYLSQDGIGFFTEHDGFRADREVNVPGLEAFIETATGIALRIERKK